MANYRAISEGNWDNLAIWQDDSTGSYTASTVLPSITDIVYSNNFRVTLNVDIAVNMLKNTASTNADVGGDFYVQSVDRTIVADVESGNNWCLYLQSMLNESTNGPMNVVLYGNSTSGNQASIACRCTNNSARLNFVMYGNITPNNNIPGIDMYGPSSVRFFSITIVGNSSGKVASTNLTTVLGSVNLTGIFTAGAFDCFPPAFDTFTAVGVFTASATNSICVGHNTCVGNISGLIENVNSRMAFVFNSMYLNPTSSLVWKFYDSNNDEKFLFTEDAFDAPIEADVRDGVVYGAGVKTGTLEVENYIALPIALQTRLENVTTEEILVTQLANLNFD